MLPRHTAHTDHAPPIAVPPWPDLRYADLIDLAIRDLRGADFDALLQAIARAMDEYLVATLTDSRTSADLESALDDILRQVAPAIGNRVREHFAPDPESRACAE